MPSHSAGATVPPDAAYNRPTRVFEIRPEDMTERQAGFVDRMLSGPRGRIPINQRAWLHNPDFLDVAEPFGFYVSQSSPLSKREREIVVLVNARFWQAPYERHMHERHALNAGITEKQVAAILAGDNPDFPDPREQTAWELAVALHEHRRVPDALYERVLASYGQRGISDLIGLMGLYTMIAFTLNFYDVPAPQS